MSLTLYIPLYKEFRLLPAQVEICRRFIKDISRIVVLETPVGKFDFNSGGPYRLKRSVADDLEIEIVESTKAVLGYTRGERIARIFRWCVNFLIPQQKEDYALILSGDVLPLHPVSIDELLCGYQIATRGPVVENNIIWCWIATKGGVELDINPYLGLPPMKIWEGGGPATLDDLLVAAPVIGNTEAIKNLIGVSMTEYLPPCFIHLDKISYGFDSLKFDLVSEAYNVKIPEREAVTEFVEDAPNWRFRYKTPSLWWLKKASSRYCDNCNQEFENKIIVPKNSKIFL